jgi:hypothetical protein
LAARAKTRATMFGMLRGFFGLGKDGRSKRIPSARAQPGTRPYFEAVQQVCRAPRAQARRVRMRTRMRSFARSRVRARAELVRLTRACARARARGHT